MEKDLRLVFSEVARAGFCSHPIRMKGRIRDLSNGRVARREVAISCKERRAVLCPACSRRYQEDAFQLVAAGLRGGKGVPESVTAHPSLFVTLTAPSFGPVHSRPSEPGRSTICRRGRSGATCHHGVEKSCVRRHHPEDPVLGDPICAACFDYEGAVLWNATASLLWQRTTTAIVRTLGEAMTLREQATRRLLRLSYVKVAEFQRRGLIHLHVVVRADGPDGPETPPPSWCDETVLSGALRGAVQRVSVERPLSERRSGWGPQLDVRALSDSDDPLAVASYVAKYVTKAVDDGGALARPVRSEAVLEAISVRPHLAELARTALVLSRNPELSELRLREHAHTLGFRGQVQTKSIRYSTTFKALRQARTDFRRSEPDAESPESHPDWSFAGRGYDSVEAVALARMLAEVANERRRARHEATRR